MSQPAAQPRAMRLHAAWVLPVSAPAIRDGALLVGADGRIVAVGPDRAVPTPEEAAILELGAAALMPGLVNTHAHPELALFRGLLENLPFHRWIRGLLHAKRAVPDLDYDLAADWACAESVAAGITTVAATEDSGAAQGALRRSGLRGLVFREVFGPAPEQVDEAMAGLRAKVEAMRRDATDLVRVGVSPHAPYTVSDALYAAVADFARGEALPVALHIAESEAESRLVAEGAGPFAELLGPRGIATPVRGRSPIGLIDRLGVLSLRPLLIHCIRVDAQDVARIADAGATVAHCPIANARLGHGVAPLDHLLEAGIAVGLGTDSVGSNNRQDVLDEARAGQLLHRARLRDPAFLDAPRLLRMATLDGARALGWDDRIGSLEPAKDADLCAVRLDGPHATPVHEPHAAVLLAARGADVVLTAVRGRILLLRRDGPATGVAPTALPGSVVQTPELEALRARVEAEATRLRETTAREYAARQGGSPGADA